MEKQFSQKLVQVQRIPGHVVDQYLYRMEFPKHQNNMGDTENNKGYFFTARVSKVNVKTNK